MAASSSQGSSSPMSTSSSSSYRRSESRFGRSESAVAGSPAFARLESLRRRFGRAQSLPENPVVNSQRKTILAYVVSNLGLRTRNYISQIFPRLEPGNDFFRSDRTGFDVLPSDKVKLAIAENQLYLSGTFEEENGVSFTVVRRDLSARGNSFFVKNPATLVHEGAAVAALKGYIYFVGVIRDTPLRPKPECTYRFSTTVGNSQREEHLWEKMAAMGRGASHSTVVAWNDYLFRFGGITFEGKIVNHVERFNSNSGAKGKWKVCRSMRTPRAFASSVRVEDDIYVLGGFTEGSPFSLCSVEKYNVPTKQCTFSLRMTVGRSNFGACQFQGDIVIVGGTNQRPAETYSLAYVFNEETQQYQVKYGFDVRRSHANFPITVDTLRSVERYSIADDEWEAMEDTTDISNVKIGGTCSVVSF